MFDVIAFDADDTLWHTECHFLEVQERFRELLRPFAPDTAIQACLHTAIIRNIEPFGYGIKSFVLSMIEAAVELSAGRIPGSQVQRIVDFGHEMRARPVEPLPGVTEVLASLAGRRLMVVTKGDLLDQEDKLARSGLGHRFWRLEVLSEKDEAAYRGVLERCGAAPERFLMVGNSVRSDVLPVLALGGHAVHVPYPITWAHERVEGVSGATHGYAELSDLRELPAWLARREA